MFTMFLGTIGTYYLLLSNLFIYFIVKCHGIDHLRIIITYNLVIKLFKTKIS